MSVFTPQVMLKIGEENYTPVPPEHLKELRYTSKMGGWYEIEAVLFEPWYLYEDKNYVSMEDRILRSKVEQGDGERELAAGEMISFKIGVMQDSKKVVWGPELNTALNNFHLEFSDGGVDISLTAFAWPLAKLNSKGYNRGMTLKGKRSEVAAQLAAASGLSALIEETDDSNYEVDKDGNETAKTREWTMGTLTPLQFIRQKLRVGARSLKSGRADYEVQLREGDVLVFAPPVSPKWGRPLIKDFSYLFSKQETVKEFKPDFNSKLLGAWGRGSFLARTYNTHKKEMVTKQIVAGTPKTTDTESGIEQVQSKSVKGVGPATTNAEVDPKNGVIAAATSGSDSKDLGTEVESDWAMMHNAAFNATASFVGNLDTYDMIGGDVISMNVLLPNGKSHWASGDWLITEVVHAISSDYSVSTTMQRDFGHAQGTVKNPAPPLTSRLKAEFDNLDASADTTAPEPTSAFDRLKDQESDVYNA